MTDLAIIMSTNASYIYIYILCMYAFLCAHECIHVFRARVVVCVCCGVCVCVCVYL